jgi:hypothetical protein
VHGKRKRTDARNRAIAASRLSNGSGVCAAGTRQTTGAT